MNKPHTKKFKSNFDLVQHSINIARDFVKHGEEVNIDQLLKDVQNDPTYYEEKLVEKK